MGEDAEIEERVVATLAEFVQDWGIEAPITPGTRLVEDLEFDSIDVIQFIVELEKTFQSRRIGFQDLLMQDGRYVDDLSVAEFRDFLARRLPELAEAGATRQRATG